MDVKKVIFRIIFLAIIIVTFVSGRAILNEWLSIVQLDYAIDQLNSGDSGYMLYRLVVNLNTYFNTIMGILIFLFIVIISFDIYGMVSSNTNPE